MSDFNIVVAHFGHHNRIVMTDTLYQYDYGQKLKVEGITALPQTFQAHFSNVQRGGVSITVTGINGMVDVPNSLLMTGKRIYCWIYVTETGSGETVYQILMPVQSRPMPEYYDVEDVGVFDSVVQQVAGYAATATAGAENAGASASAAAASADNAAASADSASASASAAAQSRTDAGLAATAASNAAQDARRSANAAAEDAGEAAQSAGTALTYRDAAQAAATEANNAKADAVAAASAAAQSATAAGNAATGAGQAASAAVQSASAAAGSATTAQGAAQTATTKAGEASASADAAATSETAAQSAQSAAETAATTATAKATEAAASATAAAQAAASINTPDSALSGTSTNAVQNKVITGEVTQLKNAIDALKIVDTASGAIASFSDGAAMPVEGLTVELEPIQDLHGQDAPYPAGGGSNICGGLALANDIKGRIPSAVIDDIAQTVSFSAGATVKSDVYIPSNYTYKENTQYTFIITVSNAIFEMSNLRIVYTDGTGTTFANLSAVETKQTIVAVSAANKTVATLTKSNQGGTTMLYCAESGIFEGVLTAADFAPYENICPISGRTEVTVTRTGKNLCSTGEFVIPTNSSSNLYWEGRLTGTFTISADKTGITDVGTPSSSRWIRVKANGVIHDLMYDADSLTVTGELTAIYIYGSLAYAKVSGTVAIQIEPGSTATNYEPYQGMTATVSLGQTVYGGTVDIATGKLTVDRAMVTFDGGFYKHNTALNAFYKDNAVSNAAEGKCVSNLFKYKASTLASLSVGEFTIDTSYTRVAFKTDIFSGATECNAYLAEHPLTVVYPLATPIEIDLTPAQLSTLKGQNNVWSDADSVTVDYVADPKLYIARLTEPDADMVADANITSGKYFMVGNNLYLATANIESGGAIVPGTNCTKTNLAEALNAINA